MVTQAICIKNVQVEQYVYGSLFTVCCDRRGEIIYEKHVVHRTTNKDDSFPESSIDLVRGFPYIHLYSIDIEVS